MRYVVEAVDGQVYDITNMFNGVGAVVEDPDEAFSIVIKVNDDCWISTEAERHAIHTVH